MKILKMMKLLKIVALITNNANNDKIIGSDSKTINLFRLNYKMI